MLPIIKPAAFIYFMWIYRFALGEENSFYELMNNPPDQLYFNKYGICAVSTSRLHDAYLAEEELIEKIQKGYEYIVYNKKDKLDSKEYEELDTDIKKQMKLIIEAREIENHTAVPMDHPINVIHFLRRVVFHFNPLLNKVFTSNELIRRTFYQDLSASIDRIIREHCSCWPTAVDLQVAISGLARISKTYKLSKHDLVKGIVMGHKSYQTLKLDEIIVLAQEANRKNYHEDVLEWTDLLLNEREFQIEKKEGQFNNVIRMRAAALSNVNSIEDSINYLEKMIKKSLFNTKFLKRDLTFYKSKLETDKSIENRENSNILTNQDRLCRENPSSVKNDLRCFYRRNRKGWDRTKIELLYSNPPIFKYYGVLKIDDINDIFNLVKNTRRKLHLYQQKGEIMTGTNNAKEETTFWDEDEDIMKRFSKKISYYTGLETNNHKYNTKLSSSGQFKIINYGLGGFEESQVDYLTKDKTKSKKDVSVFGGDRLATWVYQLTDKIEGGRTIFPKINVSVPIEQGTGLLWFNMMRNGTTNPLSEHMDCPIAVGSKWVIKKFIHENGNMFTRKCLRRIQLFI